MVAGNTAWLPSQAEAKPATHSAAPESPTGLLVNYARNPHGIDTPRPLFSWIVNDPDRGEVQTAYHIIVSSTKALCEAGHGDLWDTGKVPSPAQNDIRYQGAPLASRNSCWWKVRTWDKDAQVGAWSVPATFELAFLQQSAWTASWIGGDFERYRTEILLPDNKTIAKARAYISAKEIFDLNINGARVGGDRVMEPGESVFTKRMRYCTYDVTSNLRLGSNAIGVAVGRGRIGHWWLKSGDREFMLQIEIVYTDGSARRIVTDKEIWKATKSGPLIPLPPNKSELFQGETYDARNEDDWTNPGFDDSSWTVVTTARPAVMGSPLTAQIAPPMKVRPPMEAKAITQPLPGVFVFDFGQKISGWSRLTVNGSRGATVTLRHGDKLYTPQTWADYTLTLNATILNSAAGIRFRIADDDNFYLAQLKTNGLFVLQKKVKGVWTKIKDAEAQLVENKPYLVKIELVGATIRTSIDGKLIDTTEDAAFRSGKVGFWQHGGEAAAFDHIFVEPISHFDLSRGSPYSIKDGSSDEGLWVNRHHLKSMALPAQNFDKARGNSRQFILTDNETMQSYDGGVTGQVDQSNLHAFNSNYFADSTDRYTLRGGAEESWEPHFTLHGFRYVEVFGYPGVPTVDSVKARPAHAAIDENPSAFTCSDDLLNKLHSAFVWTFKSSAQFGYVCDYGRDERTGWVGNNSMGEVYNFDILNLYDSWLTDFQDTQIANGKISRVAPQQVDTDNLGGQDAGTPWLASYLTQPWDVYMAYGSKALLEKRYESMRKLVDFLRTDQVTNNIDCKPRNSIANWATQSLRPKTAYRVDPKLAGTSCLYQCVDLLSRMAKELGHLQDAKLYTTESKRIKDAFNARFLVENRTYQGEKKETTQTALAMALDMGLCPEAARANVVKSLAENIRQNDLHLTTGVCGTRSLLSALCDNGEKEIAFALATQTTFPSWGKWIVDGLTTCCEHWNEHYSLDIYYLGGPLDAYLFKYLAGVMPTEPGYAGVRVKPMVSGDLARAAASIQTVRGTVVSQWERGGQYALVLNVTVPVNTRAEIFVPTLGIARQRVVISEGDSVIWNSGSAKANTRGVQFQAAERDYVVFRVGSGNYSFHIKQPQS